MVYKADQERVKSLVTETITMLCKNGLHYRTEFSIQGLIGITIDKEEIFLVSINETFNFNNENTQSQKNQNNSIDEMQQNQFSSSSGRLKMISSCPSNNNNNNNNSSSSQFNLQDKIDASPIKNTNNNSNNNSNINYKQSLPTDIECYFNETESTAEQQQQTHDDFTNHTNSFINSSTNDGNFNEMISIKNESDIILDENNSYKPSSSSIDGSQVYNPLNSTDDYLNFITNPALNRSVGNQSQPDLPVIYGRRQKMKKIISGTKTKYVCQICNKLFAYSSALIHHENSAHNRRPHPFKCLICGKGFWNQRSHRGHMTSKHLMQTEYCCPVCQKEYAYKVSLKEHMKLNHNIIQ